MTINFPTSLDDFTNPSGTDALNAVLVQHSVQHSNINDAVEAIQAKVGVNSSTDVNSHDYKIAALQTGKSDTGHTHNDKAGLVSNAFTGTQTITIPTATQVGLTVKTSDDDPTKNIVEIKKADNSDILTLGINDDLPSPQTTDNYVLRLLNGFDLPVDAEFFTMVAVDESWPGSTAGLFFHNKRNDGYSAFHMRNDLNDPSVAFEMGLGGSAEAYGYDNVAYFFIGSGLRFMTFDVWEAGQYFQFQTAAGVTLKIAEDGITLSVVKSGATQAAAGATAGQPWVTSGHATLPDGVMMMGL